MIDSTVAALQEEVDRFMCSDQEIRNKLRDSNRSPLRRNDLYTTAIEDSRRRLESIRSAQIRSRNMSAEKIIEKEKQTSFYAPYNPPGQAERYWHRSVVEKP